MLVGDRCAHIVPVRDCQKWCDISYQVRVEAIPVADEVFAGGCRFVEIFPSPACTTHAHVTLRAPVNDEPLRFESQQRMRQRFQQSLFTLNAVKGVEVCIKQHSLSSSL